MRLHREEVSLTVDSSHVTVFKSDTGLAIIKSLDHTRVHGDLWHMSVSVQDRLPTWDEMLELRNKLLPMDIDFMMMFPKQEDYVNLHPFCLHLYQCPTAWDMQ